MNQIPLISALLGFASRLRFRQLFFITGGLFLLDVLLPDFIPFADELILGLLTLLFASWKKPGPAGQRQLDTDNKPAGKP